MAREELSKGEGCNRRPDRQRGFRARHKRGYTAIEVMMALGVLTVGTTGVVAMQKAAIVGNMRARNLATANAIGTSWLERLRVDGLAWRLSTTGLSTLPQTTYLKVVGDDFPAVAGDEGFWVRPIIDVAGRQSPMGDVRGVDVYTEDEAVYCTHIRLTQVLPNLVRAEVRVVWLRTGGGGSLQGLPLCTDDAQVATNIDTSRDRYHSVHLTTGILRDDS